MAEQLKPEAHVSDSEVEVTIPEVSFPGERAWRQRMPGPGPSMTPKIVEDFLKKQLGIN